MKKLILFFIAILLPATPLAEPGDNQYKRSEVFELSNGAATVTMITSHYWSHNFAGVIYYNDESGDTNNVVTPTAGTETYTLETVFKPGVFQTFTNNTLSSNTPSQVDWSANTVRVRVVLAGVSGNGVTHVRLVFYGNES